MAALTDYFENKLIDWLFRGQPYTPPATVYIGLLTSPTTEDGGGVEVLRGTSGYDRVAIPSSLANWAGTQAALSTTASSGNTGTTSNNLQVSFPTPLESWGTVTHFGIFETLTGSTMIVHASLNAAKTIFTSDVVVIAPSTLVVQLDD